MVSDFTRGGYNLMIHVGTDTAKLNHFAIAISSDSEILIEPFKLSNSYDGFYLLLSRLAPLDQNSVIIGLESTAHYGDNLVRFLISKDFKVCVLNPIQTSLMRKDNVRKAKTDKAGTFVIAKALMIQDSLRLMALEGLDYIELKELGRLRRKLVKQRTRLKIQLIPYVDQAFPELQYSPRPGLHQNSVYTVPKEASTPSAIVSMRLTHLAYIFGVASHGHSGKDKARESGVLAQKSVGINDSSLSIQITHTIEQIELSGSQLFFTGLEMANLTTYLHPVIMATPGIGIMNGGMILGEIGDMHQPSNPEKPLALAGLDLAIHQSGNFQAYRTRMSKRGSKALRYALMNAAHNVIENNATFKAYYDAKGVEGRTHHSALGHCAGKPARITWKVLIDEIAFNLEQEVCMP